MIIDDIDPLLRAMSGVLSRRLPCVDVTTATSAEEGLALAQQSPPDVIVTDYHLGAASGLELGMRLRLELPEVGIALMSAYGTIPLSLGGLGAAGIDCFLQKPFNPISLTQAVRYLVNAPSGIRQGTRSTGALHVAADMGEERHGVAFEMRCFQGHVNPASSRFCGQCGRPLSRRPVERYDPYRGSMELALAFRARIKDPQLLALYDRGVERMLAQESQSRARE